MNKLIREATKEEIKEAYKNQCIKTIYKKRKQNIVYEYKYVALGELIPHCTYTIKQAEKDNLGLDYRLWFSNKRRKNRLEDKIEEIINSGKAVFLTMTFKDEVINTTSPETRRRKIARYLKSQASKYVANIDFGQDDRFTKREHYHAVLIPLKEKVDYKAYNKLFNNSRIHSEKVRQPSQKDTISIGLYLNKLTNHALKTQGFQKRFIYSRS